MALAATQAHFAWQVWHFLLFCVFSRGKRGPLCDSIALRLACAACRACAPLLRGSFCLAGAAFRTLLRRFAWQVWYFLEVSASFRVAGVSLVATQVHFASQV